MILRKPYAILIKNFKLIHFILAILMSYIAYKTYNILNFLNDYLDNIATTISSDITNSLFKPLVIISILITLILSIIIIILLSMKKKPIKFYMYNMAVYLFYLIFYIITSGVVKRLEIELIEVKTLKIFADLSLLSLIIEILALLFVIIRATGFDIKNFNFKQDLVELEIDDKDSEEFEVETEIDKDLYKRKYNKAIRHLKYMYIENKFFFNSSFIITIFVVFLLIYNAYSSVYGHTHTNSSKFTTNLYNFEFIDSYYTNKDYSGNKIVDDYLLVVRFKIKTLYGNRSFETGRFHLNIGDKKYYNDLNYKNSLFDFGPILNKNTITNSWSTYQLVFKIPKNDVNKKLILKYTDTNYMVVKIKINPKAIDDEVITNIDIDPGNQIIFSKSLLNNSSINISNYEIATNFKLLYNYCFNNNCKESYEYLKPSVENRASHLLKITGSYNIDETLNLTKINDLFKLFKYFGKITYQKDNNIYTMNIPIKEVKPKKVETNDIYIEITDKVATAEKIYIVFKIRNRTYTYILK